MEKEVLLTKKIYWRGSHLHFTTDLGKPWVSPLGKLPKSTIQYLHDFGWKKVDENTNEIPIFSFMTRKCGDFSLQSPCPTIRQFPIKITDLLDDKIQLFVNMKKFDFEYCLPQTFIDFKSFDIFYTEEKQDNKRFFVKHKWGVKGKSVYPLRNFEEIKKHFKEGQHIIQKEVIPYLINERKFVVRVHVLVLCDPFEIYVHQNCIVLSHGEKYDENNDKKDIHVSSAGKNLPIPFLLNTLKILYDKTFPQIKKIAYESISIIQSSLISIENTKLFHLFGYDFIVDKNEKVILLEINSYPALGNGTMNKVPKQIFEEMLIDFVNLAVLPVTDNKEKQIGRFVKTEKD